MEFSLNDTAGSSSFNGSSNVPFPCRINLKEEDQAVIYKVTVWLVFAKISDARVDVLCSFSELLGQISIIFAPLKR